MGGTLEKEDEASNTCKTETATPTKGDPPWAKMSGGPDLLEALRRFDGRLTLDDMIRDFGWDPKRAKFNLDLLVTQ